MLIATSILITRPSRLAPALAGLLVTIASTAAAQETRPVEVVHEAFVGSEVEGYMRLLQLRGEIPAYPWSIRGFSPLETGRLSAEAPHPWVARYTFGGDPTNRAAVRPLQASIGAIYNSGFPYGRNDGAVWAGRGITSVARAGLALRAGPVSLTLAPVAFRAQNGAFTLARTGLAGDGAFRDPDSPGTIDLPQRFGDEPYTRIDPGESTLRVDLPFVTVGVSTASQHWGPAREHPLILGNTAGGYPHAFLGTSAPQDIWIGKVHGRAVWGVLSQSEYSPATGDDRRFMSGAIAVFVPRGIPGLELGGARFFHSPWPEGGFEAGHFLKPLEGLLKERMKDTGITDGKSDLDNQLASVFARWLLPRSGVEVYGEYAREDHSWNGRDLLAEPDLQSGYMLGVAKAWELSRRRLLQLRAEVINTRTTHLQLVRRQAKFYRHTRMVQGHTHRGQPLGSSAGYGGGGSVLAADLYHRNGRTTLAWSRAIRGLSSAGGERVLDVVNGIEVESVLFRGPIEWTGGVAAVHEMNRYYTDDSFNLRASLQASWRW